MKLSKYLLRNFRRLENVQVNLDKAETIFVGPNNSGKTSSASAFRIFIEQKEQFSIYDFPASLIQKINSFDFDSEGELPTIELDLWFTVDPATEYGRVASFLPSLSLEHSEIGVRIVFSVDDAEDLKETYLLAYPPGDDQKNLTHFLAQAGNLNKFFSLKYFTLEFTPDSIIHHSIEKNEGRSTLSSLLKVDFVEAQRGIDDLDSAKSNRLSSVFADFYRYNLKQHENDAQAISTIDKSNEGLTEHYKEQFQPLIDVISELGFPSVNDRELRILSTLSPETVLKGNTTLQYIDDTSGHELPEAYNGLGFKNLIFIAIQLAHFIKRWLTTETKRPLCHLIFIEEPEVHLHAQVQQVFVRQITTIAQKIAKENGDENLMPQFIITTHSSHIIDEIDFTKVRYFRRVVSKYQEPASNKKTASTILSLSEFDEFYEDKDNLKFLKKYMRITHCDLFFADAVILVEGAVERLLLPQFIAKSVKSLERAYCSTLEVGGAYAHIFIPLLEYINIPALIITDLDSVKEEERTSEKTEKKYKASITCRADDSEATTSNQTIIKIFEKETITELLALGPEDKEKGQIYTVFQGSVPVPTYGEQATMTPRTLEEAFIYQNIDDVINGKINALVKIEKPLDYDSDYKSVYEKVSSKGFKKVDFAMEQIFTEFDWATPKYIKEGLKWLSTKTLVQDEIPEIENPE
jgi:putative ATP-dependent endonuclease of the OLD family